MSGASNQTKSAAKRSIRSAVVARIVVSLGVIILWLLLFPVFSGSRGSMKSSKWISSMVSVNLRHSLPKLPEVYLCVMQVTEDGDERAIVKKRLRRGKLVESNGRGNSQPRLVFHYEFDFMLEKFYPRGRGNSLSYSSYSVGVLMHGDRPVAHLWHPERYRLQVTSPLNIKSEPSYYRVSELDFWGEYDFVVTVLEGTQQ